MVSRMECLLYVWIKKTTIHYKNLFVYSHKKSKFVILCHRDLIPPTNIPAVSQKEISYFGPGKKVPAILSKKMRLGNFCILVRIFCFAQRTSKIESHTFLYALYKTGSHIFLYPSNKIESTKFQWED